MIDFDDIVVAPPQGKNSDLSPAGACRDELSQYVTDNTTHSSLFPDSVFLILVVKKSCVNKAGMIRIITDRSCSVVGTRSLCPGDSRFESRLSELLYRLRIFVVFLGPFRQTSILDHETSYRIY